MEIEQYDIEAPSVESPSMGKEHGILTNQGISKEHGILLDQDMDKEHGIFLNQDKEET